MQKKQVDIDKYCVFCERSTILDNDCYVLCERKGVVSSTYNCKKFVYDPLKRNPHTPQAQILEYIDIDK